MQLSLDTPIPSESRILTAPLHELLSRTLGRIIKVIQDTHHSPQERAQTMKNIVIDAFFSTSSSECAELNHFYISKLEESNAELIQKIDGISAKNISLKGQFKVLNKKTKNLKDQQVRLESAQKQTQLENNLLTNETHALKTDIKKLNEKYESLDTTYKGLENQNLQLSEKANTLEVNYDQLKEQLTHLKTENQALTTESGELKENYTLLDKKYETLQKETGNLQIKFDHLNAKYVNLQESVKEANSKIQSNHEKILKDKNKPYACTFKTLERHMWCIVPIHIQKLIEIGKKWFGYQIK